MQAENYTTDLMGNPNLAGRYPLKRDKATISKRAVARMVREAQRDYLVGYDIDWSRYDEPEIMFHDMLTAEMTWTHKVSGRKLCLSHVWFEKRTGEILQAGTNYGNLTL